MKICRGINIPFRKFHSTRLHSFLKGNSPICRPSLNQKGRKAGATLWKYINAPGNTIFITTNIVTLSSMMLYSTISSFYRQSIMANSLENDFHEEEHSEDIDETKLQSVRSITPEKTAAFINPYRIITSSDSHNSVDSIDLPEYMEELTTDTSYFVKITIFYLLYSFHVYKASVNYDTTDDNKGLPDFVEKLRHLKPDNVQIKCCAFYRVWKEEFNDLLSGLGRCQQFHFPDPSLFPSELQDTLRLLEENPMDTHKNFYTFYVSLKSVEQKQLLQQWYYDNCNNLKKMNDFSNETLYLGMIRDSLKWDEQLFEKYLNLIFKPNSYRSRSVFNNYYVGFPSISLSTSLEIFKNLLSSNLELKNEYVTRIVSLLQKNSIISSKQNIRILLSSKRKTKLMNELMTPSVKEKTFSAMAKNPMVLELLSSINKSLDQ